MKQQTLSNYDRDAPLNIAQMRYGHASVKGINIINREAERPASVLRQGLPTLSHICRGVLAGLIMVRKLMNRLLILLLFIPQWAFAMQVETSDKPISAIEAHPSEHLPVRYGYESVEGINIFYREAGEKDKPVIVLLHGFPASSHMYREVLAGLADDYYLIAPDYPSFGNSSFPDPEAFDYTFDNIARVIDLFLAQKGIDRFSMMIQDYGAPIGFRLAVKHPERIQAIITQNGNAYKEGLSAEGWGPIFDYWKQKTTELETIIAENVFTLEGMKWQFTHGTRQPETILPDNWGLAYANIARPGQQRVQLDLFYDYQNNLLKYPEWQHFLRVYKPPVLIVWGKNDAFFPVEGAEAYRKDVTDLDYNVLDTGHFALEEEAPLIINKIRAFLKLRNIR